MPHETLIVARDGAVLKVTLNRPESRNAMSPQMVAELAETFRQARDDDGIRVVVLMGAGGTFCAGGDLKGMKSSDAARGSGTESTASSNRIFGAMLEAIESLPKAVIALVEGACMGGGVGLLAVADWVVAEKGAQIGTPEVTVGIVPAQITPFVVRRIGPAHAQRMTAFGLRLGAEEAHRIGLVHEIAAGRDELLAKGIAAVNQSLRCAPGAMAETKRLVRASQHGPLGPVLDQAAHAFAASLAGDAKEGIRAFLDKRKPAWVQTIETL